MTGERLRQVDAAERALRALGITGDLRVRHHDDLARVELAESELPRWLGANRAAQLREAVAGAGFTRVSIELRGFRSGSLNVLEGVVAS